MGKIFWSTSIQASLLFYAAAIALIAWMSGCDKAGSKSQSSQKNPQVNSAGDNKDEDQDEDTQAQEDEEDSKDKKSKTKNRKKEEKPKENKPATPKASPLPPASPGQAKPTPPATNPPATPSPMPPPANQPNPQLVMFACGSKMTAPQLLAWVAAGQPAPGMTPQQFADIKASLDGVTEQQLADFLTQNCKPAA